MDPTRLLHDAADRSAAYLDGLPDFPFGTDLTADELRIAGALRQMQHASQHPAELLAMLAKSLWTDAEAPPAYLQRLGLDEATSLRKMLMRKLFAGNLCPDFTGSHRTAP